MSGAQIGGVIGGVIGAFFGMKISEKPGEDGLLGK